MLATSQASTGIDFEINSDDGDGTDRDLGGCQSPSASGENHVNFEICKFNCEFSKKFGLVVRGSVLQVARFKPIANFPIDPVRPDGPQQMPLQLSLRKSEILS
jgi:hypothetical protein